MQCLAYRKPGMNVSLPTLAVPLRAEGSHLLTLSLWPWVSVSAHHQAVVKIQRERRGEGHVENRKPEVLPERNRAVRALANPTAHPPQPIGPPPLCIRALGCTDAYCRTPTGGSPVLRVLLGRWFILQASGHQILTPRDREGLRKYLSIGYPHMLLGVGPQVLNRPNPESWITTGKEKSFTECLRILFIIIT